MSAPLSIYLVRHAIAEERGDKWPDDAMRPLTHGGAARMRRAIAGLRALDMKVDVVLTSPLVRAVETAELLVEELRPVPELRYLSALAPGGSPAKIADAVAAVHATRGVALVGHEPDLGELAAWLTGLRTALAFRKGGVCRLDLVAPAATRSAQIVWVALPKMLRALG
jgi:phosphohistidine phosphatase